MSSEVTAMFLSLPDELLVSILAYLCTSDRVRCSSINHRLKSIIDETILLQTQTECELANVTINPSRRAVPLANALQSLKEHQEAWRTLRWTNDMSVLMQVESEEHDIHVQGRDCGILGQVTADNRLVFTQIPSKVRGIEKRTWTLDNFTFPIADFTLDEREDLLVMVENVLTDPVGIVEVKLHMLLLTNGTAHPLGSAPISLNVPPFYGTSRLGFPVFKLAIAGECLGVMMGLLRDGQHNDIISHFWLCDWRTGELKQ
ncbi:hypothetical protein BC835DRAFT_203177 [Cytidiella melzeri]|nr:hypothetical protein BC835DRAFT_203177 [Cytidiella melzeri]